MHHSSQAAHNVVPFATLTFRESLNNPQHFSYWPMTCQRRAVAEDHLKMEFTCTIARFSYVPWPRLSIVLLSCLFLSFQDAFGSL